MLPTDTIWAVEPTHFQNAVGAFEGVNVAAVAGAMKDRRGLPFVTRDGIAIVRIDGILTPDVTLFQLLFGGHTTTEIRLAIEEVGRRDDVKAVLLQIDSPGGSTRGIAELGDAVYAVRRRKPVIAHGGLIASASYHVASQAQAILLGRMDQVGSIGVFALRYDFSEAFHKGGVKPVLMKTGEHKGAGLPGTEITEKQQAHFQTIVDAYQGDFLAAIKRGRPKSFPSIEKIADGRVFVAPDAIRHRLIDGMATFAETFGQFKGAVDEAKAAEPPKPQESPAVAEFRRKLRESPTSKAGAKPVTTPTNPIREWNAAIAAKKRQGMTQAQAVRAVAKEQPDLHAQFVRAANTDRPVAIQRSQFAG